MPIYEYRCEECGYHFSRLFRSVQAANKAETPTCPACGDTNVKRLISPIAVHLGESSAPPEEEESSEEAKEVFGRKELEQALEERGY
ncbi:MAG: zinc ribbon domain-containing protein [Chloroflexota bacterium]|nr:zinc ribbon domain-containing protein [Chloroflexota bacterium]